MVAAPREARAQGREGVRGPKRKAPDESEGQPSDRNAKRQRGTEDQEPELIKLCFIVNNELSDRRFYAKGFDWAPKPTRADRHTYMYVSETRSWVRIGKNHTPILATGEDSARYMKDIKDLNLYDYP